MKEKPKAIKVLAIIILVFAILGIVVNFGKAILIWDSQYSGELATLKTYSGIPIVLIIETITFIFLHTLALVGSIGLLQSKEWGRKLLTIAFILMLASLIILKTSVLYQEIIGGFFDTYLTAFTIFRIFFYGINLWYFNRKDIKTYFS